MQDFRKCRVEISKEVEETLNVVMAVALIANRVHEGDICEDVLAAVKKDAEKLIEKKKKV